MWPFDARLVRERDEARAQVETLKAKDIDSQRVIFALEKRVEELRLGLPNGGMDSDAAWEMYSEWTAHVLWKEYEGDPTTPNDNKVIPNVWITRLAFKTAWDLKRCG